jgi:nucleotide-binding universal stress UspA family protein
MKTIIVGVDGSKNAPLVLDAAAALSRRMGAEIVLVTTTSSDGDAEGIQALAARHVGGAFECIIERGQAWRAICDAAKTRSASAIVVGAHSYSGLERALGTTAARVVNHADVPVLVVRGTLSFDRILVAHDGSKRAPAVLSYALRFLAPAEGRLVLVRAIEPLLNAPFGPSIDLLQIEKLFAEDVAATAPSGRTDIHAHVGVAWEVVLAATKASDATLVVVGSHGYQAIDRVLGTTAARIVNHADRCVLVVKGDALAANVATISVAAAG